jgi:inner membrane protein
VDFVARMDNVTHSLVGLTIAKAGLEKLSPGTAIVCVVAANAADLDLVAGLCGDRWTLLHYHRGITHSLLGTVLLGVLIPSLFCLGDSLVAWWRGRAGSLKFRGLLVASIIACASHLLLDWTNNYGVRPLLPWSGKWFYGDLVFIADPFMWLVLGAVAFLLTSRYRWQLILWSIAAAILTTLFVYAGAIRSAFDHPKIAITIWIAALGILIICRRVGYPWQKGRWLAFAGLCVVLGYWFGLALLHGWALDIVRREAPIKAAEGEQVTRMAAMPTLANPTRWQFIVETDQAFYRFDLLLLDRSNEAHNLTRFAKPDGAEQRIIAIAEQDRRTKILLDFARFPLGHVVDRDCLTETLVQFADIRYTEPGRQRGSFSLELPVECPGRP